MQRIDLSIEKSGAPPPWPLSQTPPRRRRHAAALHRWVTLAVGLLLATAVSVGPAWAHGGAGGAQEGYVFVQQALGHLARDTPTHFAASSLRKSQ